MRLLILVNAVGEVGVEQSTWGLAHVAMARGHEVGLCGVMDLSHGPDGSRWASAAVLGPGDRGESLAAVKRAGRARWGLGAGDVLWMRTNPARDEGRARAHGAALSWAALAERDGARVVNRPGGLSLARDKMYLTRLPSSWRPRTLVSSAAEEIEAFVEGLGGAAVLKPLSGTHGRDVFLVKEGDMSNFAQILDVLRRGGGYVVAQEYVPEASRGDVRVILCGGVLLEGPGGEVAAIRRVPPPRGFRSNVHAGGRAEVAEVTDQIRAMAAEIGPILAGDGLWLAGVDLIGGVIVEVNAYSPGGISDVSGLLGVDFEGAVLTSLERLLDSGLEFV